MYYPYYHHHYYVPHTCTDNCIHAVAEEAAKHFSLLEIIVFAIFVLIFVSVLSSLFFKIVFGVLSWIEDIKYILYNFVKGRFSWLYEDDE